MPEREEANAGLGDTGLDSLAHEGTEQDEGRVEEPSEEAQPLGKSIPRPSTTMPTQVKGSIEKAVVSLLDDLELAPLLEDVEKLNRPAAGESRTPLMTVIQAILAAHGGSMTLGDLAAQVTRYWNRSFPSSPYSGAEFLFILVRNSDNMRVTIP